MREQQQQCEKFVPLSHCLMESDAETTRLARRRRRRSMLLSTFIEAALLIAAIVVPLFASQTIPLIINDPPLPPPRGYTRLVDPVPAGPRQTTTVTNPPRNLDRLIAPLRIPTDIPPIDNREAVAPNIGRGEENGPSCAACVPDGTLDPNVFRNEIRVSEPPKAPVPTTQSRGPVQVSTGVQAAKLIHRVEPIYPALMRQIRKSGRVELRAIIARDGTVDELTVVKADPGFILSAQQAVRQWRYHPTLLNGEPVEVETRITVIFTIGPP